MTKLIRILFISFTLIFIGKMIVPDQLLVEMEDLVELSDDNETEEEKETDDEKEWKWSLELNIAFREGFAIIFDKKDPALRVGTTCEGEYVIFGPPPQRVV